MSSVSSARERGIASLASLVVGTQEQKAISTSQLLYENLNVNSVNVSGRMAGVAVMRKSVGGLVCDQRQAVVPGARPTYSCTIQVDSRRNDLIYNALNVQEENMQDPRLVGAAKLGKRIGAMICIRSFAVVPGAANSYECTLK